MADRVTFTRPAAERIGRVVRIVETGERVSSPWQVPVRLSNASANVEVCGWTSTWNYAQTNEIVLYSSGQTVTAINEYFGYRQPPGAGVATGIAIFDSDAWRLKCIDLVAVQGYSEIDLIPSPGYMVLGLEKIPEPPEGEESEAPPAGVFLKWFEVASCSTTT